MGAVVSLEFVFDPFADALIRREWALLQEAGLPSQARHAGASNRPHLTLLVRTALRDLPAGVLDDQLPLELTLGAPVLFGQGRTRVLARSVVPTTPMLHCHAAVHSVAGLGDDAPHTTPGEWTPHVTLARRLPLDRIGEALGVLAEGGESTIASQAIGIRRWDSLSKTISHVAGRGTLEVC